MKIIYYVIAMILLSSCSNKPDYKLFLSFNKYNLLNHDSNYLKNKYDFNFTQKNEEFVIVVADVQNPLLNISGKLTVEGKEFTLEFTCESLFESYTVNLVGCNAIENQNTKTDKISIDLSEIKIKKGSTKVRVKGKINKTLTQSEMYDFCKDLIR